MFKRAFTLIELLVVMAIISILASILLPAFAQAKAAAKGAVTLSNAKQNSLAMIMYGADTDDVFAPVGYPDPTAPIGWDPNYIRTWAQLLLPYTKTGDILLDVLAAPPDTSWGPRDAILGYAPQFGYNFEALSPVVALGEPRPIAQTSLGSPSATVMLTTKATAWAEYSPGWDGGYSLDSSFTIGAPWCNMSTGWVDGDIHPNSWCNYVSPGWRNSWGYQAEPGLSFEAGGYTNLVSFRRAGKTCVAFADGHAKSATDTEMAAGTNYTRTLAPADLVINDKEKYLWDAD